jgi:hypothetical protein
MNVKSTVFGVFGSLKLLTDGLRILGSYSLGAAISRSLQDSEHRNLVMRVARIRDVFSLR